MDGSHDVCMCEGEGVDETVCVIVQKWDLVAIGQ